MISESNLSFGQGVGYGKNYHTLNPEPVSWENISQIDYFLTTLPDGRFLAGVSLPGTEDASHPYVFNSEDEAMFWIKSVSEKFNVETANQER